MQQRHDADTQDAWAQRAASAPDWAKHLVIYELNPRGFTSPNGVGDGSGSGTFASLEEKLPYLRDLGVNGIWLAGHHEATKHFYGVWSVYAVRRPDRIDPVLGTEEDFRRLIDVARQHGIRIFLDVIAHGVLHDSPLVSEHPEWFTGSSWEMADYDYQSPAFRQWWVELWTRYAIDFGVDGFRIDVVMGDVELWDEIVASCRAKGKEIVVFPEIERYHFSQQDNQGTPRDVYRDIHINDIVGAPRGLASAQISCHDYGWENLPGNHYFAQGSRARMAHISLLSPRIPLFFAGEEFNVTPTPLPDLTQGLYGTGGPGGWLYGNQLDWSQLDQPECADMLEDVAKMLSIRRAHQHIINGDSSSMQIVPVPFDGATPFVPYALASLGVEAIMIITNPSDQAIETTVRLPRSRLGFAPDTVLTIVDLVDERPIDFADDTFVVQIGADGARGGGYRVLQVSVA